MIINFFKNLFLPKRSIISLSLEEVYVLSLPRSPLWKTLRSEHLKKFPCCEVCGNYKNVVPHHIVPFHINPSLELEPLNLISLCEGDTFNCHLFFGHFRNWTKYNPDVVKDSYDWSKKVKEYNQTKEDTHKEILSKIN